MHFKSTAVGLFTLAFATISDAQVTTCNANNCLRAVRATNFPSRSASADCSAFVRTTTTPTTTVTTVVTVTSPFLAKRDSTSPTIPAYATSACTNAAAYISACRCISVPPTTITAATVTEYTTQTTTTTSQPSASPFKLLINIPSRPAAEAPLYVNARPNYPNEEGRDYLFESTTPATFTIDTVQPGLLLVTVPGRYESKPAGYFGVTGGSFILVRVSPEAVYTPPSSCSVGAGDSFTCEFGGHTAAVFIRFEYDNLNSVVITDEESYAQYFSAYERVTLTAVPVV